MKRNLFILLATMTLLVLPVAGARSPSVQLERGIYAEETKGDLAVAVKIYKQIVKEANASRKHIAEAHYRLGVCLAKQKQSAEATRVLREFLTKFPEETKLVAQAQKQLRLFRSQISGEALSLIVTKAVMTLSTYAETDPRVKKALDSLDGLNESATVKVLVKYLDSQKDRLSRSAIYILWKGPFAKITAAQAPLLKLCKHKNGITRGMAALTLGGKKVRSSFQALCEMTLNDESAYARRCAAYALGLLGNPAARPILQKALKDKDEFVSSNAQAALEMLNSLKRLPAEVIEHIATIHMKAYMQSQPKGQPVNSHIYGVDDQFNLHFGGLLTVKNKTNKTIHTEIAVSCFSYTDFEVMNEIGALQTIRFEDRKTSRGGRYRLFWTPDKPLKPGEVRLLGWKQKTTPLTKTKGGFELTMKNHFGSPVLESFFLVVPPSVKIVKQSTGFLSSKIVGAFHVYHWRRSVPAGTTNKVELVLNVGPPDSAAETGSSPDQQASVKLARQAQLLWNQRKLKEAESLFRQAVKKDPQNATAWNGLGWALQNQGKDEAKEAFQKCIGLDPKNAAALNGMGWLAKQAGNEDQAIVWWQKAVLANPHATAALRGLTTTLMARGQYHQAAVCYAAWVKVDPNNKKIKAEMDIALAKAKVANAESKKAVAAAKKWLALIDEDKYGQSWDQSSILLRKGVNKETWTTASRGQIRSLGKVKSRVVLQSNYRTSLPGAPDGEYVVILFKTTFTNKKTAIETVTPAKAKDGTWRVSGYYIK